jgi:outer membrane lipoprotein-sorting protein
VAAGKCMGHNQEMPLYRRQRRFLLACFLSFAATTGSRAAEDAPKNQQQGWRIFLEARQAVRLGHPEVSLHDYKYELVTRTQTPNGEVELRSSGLFLAPNLVRQEIHAPSGEIVMVFDGVKAWQVVPAGKRELPAAMVGHFQADLSRSHVLLDPPPPQEAVWFLRQEEVNGKLADVIELRLRESPLRLFIDTETKDLVKTMYVGDTPSGMAQVEELYSEFVEAGGFRWPLQKRVLRNGQPASQSTKTITQVNSGLTEESILR